MKIIYSILLILGFLIVKGITAEPVKAPPSAIFTATRSGALAIDRDSFGGNPFATALIRTLGKQTKNPSVLLQLLKKVTAEQSGGYQSPDLLQTTNEPLVPFSAEFNKASKIAMVMVYSDYSGSGMQSLPGAEFDLKRIRKALAENGFDCWTLLDPTISQLEANLNAFCAKSENYNFSILYVTGHGVEVANNVYLLPSSYKITYGRDALEAEALNISEFVKYLKSPRGNFLFYGGCRNDPF